MTVLRDGARLSTDTKPPIEPADIDPRLEARTSHPASELGTLPGPRVQADPGRVAIRRLG